MFPSDMSSVWNYDPIFRGLKRRLRYNPRLRVRQQVWNYDPIFRGLKPQDKEDVHEDRYQ